MSKSKLVHKLERRVSQSGPTGDTKYDIFDRGAPGVGRMGRARMKAARTGHLIPNRKV